MKYCSADNSVPPQPNWSPGSRQRVQDIVTFRGPTQEANFDVKNLVASCRQLLFVSPLLLELLIEMKVLVVAAGRGSAPTDLTRENLFCVVVQTKFISGVQSRNRTPCGWVDLYAS